MTKRQCGGRCRYSRTSIDVPDAKLVSFGSLNPNGRPRLSHDSARASATLTKRNRCLSTTNNISTQPFADLAAIEATVPAVTANRELGQVTFTMRSESIGGLTAKSETDDDRAVIRSVVPKPSRGQSKRSPRAATGGGHGAAGICPSTPECSSEPMGIRSKGVAEM
jgi:hypothetical protein